MDISGSTTSLDLVLLLLVTPAFAQDRERADLYGKNGERKGYVIIDRSTGRVDTYDKNSARTGWGRIAPDGRVDLYSNDGARKGSVVTKPKR